MITAYRPLIRSHRSQRVSVALVRCIIGCTPLHRARPALCLHLEPQLAQHRRVKRRAQRVATSLGQLAAAQVQDLQRGPGCARQR